MIIADPSIGVQLDAAFRKRTSSQILDNFAIRTGLPPPQKLDQGKC